MEAHSSGWDSSLSLRHGVRCVPVADASVEDVLVAVGEQIGFENIVSASRMNKAVVIFLKEQSLVGRLIESGVWVSGVFCVISPLASLSTKVTISNVPPFIPNCEIERELLRFGKLASGIKMIPLGCKNQALKHVLSFRRQVFMFLESSSLDISFRVQHEGKSYMIYANTGSLKCYECGVIGHKKSVCPRKKQVEINENANGTEVVLPTEEVQRIEVGNDQVDTEKKEDSNCGAVQESESRPIVSEEIEGNCGRIVEAERSDANCTFEMENIGQKSEDHSFASQIEDEGIDHGMEEDDDDDNMSEMSDIPSQCGDEQLYTVKEINDFLDETFGKRFEVREFFPDVNKFLISVMKIQKSVGFEELNRRKRFRLKKIVTKLRRGKCPATRLTKTV